MAMALSFIDTYLPSITLMIHHIVLLKFKPETTQDEIRRTKEILAALPSQIPSISGFIGGSTVPNSLAHGFHEGVIFVFENEDALNLYRPHKAHTDYQQTTAPWITDKLIFDIEVK
ncbi:hypothetical protein BV22DRAFT_1071156 [Leucogyrophana mollusca]|uniref:Uncharacterized protein n=1 Tax=Leucogyrophana mollusca TaxID=85980 RepID=A0ACB8B8N6_9AGAM|nr:hypothetical protein BV22DRAFT_1071156 [Leucogyrophana mollusca]